jgi:glycosyltransferase involved in cell wall biosynthesis
MGGYEIGCSQMLGELRRLGHEIKLLTSFNGNALGRTEDGVDRCLHLAPIYESQLLLRVSEEARTRIRVNAHFLDVMNLSNFLRCIEEFKPDVIYFWNLIGVGGWSLLLAAQKLGLPWVMHLMDNVPSTLCTYSNGVERPLVDYWERLMMGRYITCSARLTQEIILNGPDIGSRTTVIPNWVSRENMSATDKVDPQRANSVPLRLVFAGTVAGFKGVDVVISMSKILADHGVLHTVDLFGYILEPELIGTVEALGIENYITFHGALPHADLIKRLGAYDIFVFPTWDREPMAFAPIEAMAFGCLVLMTEVNGNAEWLVHGVHCWKAARSAEAMAAAIEHLTTQPDLRRRIARNGRGLSRTQLAISRLALLVQQVLEDAMKEAPGPAELDTEEVRHVANIGILADQVLLMNPTRC